MTNCASVSGGRETSPAYLSALGDNDWEVERRLIEAKS